MLSGSVSTSAEANAIELSVCDRESVTIKLVDVPAFLHDGAFYRSLSDENECDLGVEVPRRCMCHVAEVNNLQDFEQTLRVVSFWGLDRIPECLIKFCRENDVFSWTDSIDQAGAELTFAHTLHAIFETGPESSLPRAIQLGNTEVVEYLANLEVKSEQGVIAAARCGRLDYLTILHHNAHPWGKKACAAAVENGHLSCLKYLHEHGCEWDYFVYIHASMGDFTSCIEYACAEGLAWDVNAGIAMASMNKFSTLQYAIEHGCPLHSDMTKWAAYGGNIECLQYLLDHQCPVAADTVQHACERGRIQSLQLLHRYGIACDKNAAISAAQYVQLTCLRYLHENGCPWNEEVSESAVKTGNLEILRYCLTNGCPYDKDLFLYAGSSDGDALRCVQYLIEEQGLYMEESGEIFAAAFGSANIELMRYLLDNGCPYQNNFNIASSFLTSQLKHYRTISNGEMEYLLHFDLRLLDCIQLAADRGYNFPDDLLQLICTTFPLCKEYFESEGYVACGEYAIGDDDSSDEWSFDFKNSCDDGDPIPVEM